ncbi:MAG: glutamate--cysteine ligase [Burkholderiales bacterium PBB6]|nr:MAG: glutamate--cysteine ligase [Burkholderiales bacterium PBB6]
MPSNHASDAEQPYNAATGQPADRPRQRITWETGLTLLNQRLTAISDQRLREMRRGVEKESLRSRADGRLAFTPHPRALGSALTHPHITTDFCESQVELVTGAHTTVAACMAELTELHQATARAIGGEQLWVSSMPCALPADGDIPLGQYGNAHIGQTKTVYRRGLGHRYGRRMQTISGIHYNWSLPGLNNDDYFNLIRNFRRHSFLLLLLFGASPAVGKCFVDGLPHELTPLGADTLHRPHGTSLRMGRLGYQSDAQASLAVSYNGLEGYGHSLEDALTRPWPAYEAIGLQNASGEYQQLSTSLLQIENEFYGTIRPKRTIRSGERPLHALRERGVEYVEVRCMDLNPFIDTGIDAATARFIDVFLMHCLLSDSPPDSPAEIAALGRNQHRTAEHGRQPGLMLERHGQQVSITDWALELIDACAPIAQRLDALEDGHGHADTLAAARAAVLAPHTLPSARVLDDLAAHGGSFVGAVRARSAGVQAALLGLPVSVDQEAQWAAEAAQSLAEQARLEAAQAAGGQSFTEFLNDYLATEGLSPRSQDHVPA